MQDPARLNIEEIFASDLDEVLVAFAEKYLLGTTLNKKRAPGENLNNH